jgi:hypothetical protein
MHEEATPRWMILAVKASQERDPVRLLRLVRELNQILSDRAAKRKLNELPKAS